MPPTPTEPSTDFSTKPSRTVIHIDLLPDDVSYPDSLHDLPLFSGSEGFPTPGYDDVVRVSKHPRPLRSIDPTVTFLSDSPITAKSTFTVVASGMTVFSEVTTLSPAGTVPDSADGALLYSTTLVPSFWHKIIKSSGTHFAI
jgi:transcriptional enhancer factor